MPGYRKTYEYPYRRPSAPVWLDVAMVLVGLSGKPDIVNKRGAWLEIGVKCCMDIMSRKTVVLRTNLAPDAVVDALQQSVDVEAVPNWALPWFAAPFITRPAWNGASRYVVRGMQAKSFRVDRRDAGPFTPSFYCTWQADHNGTRIEGQFGLHPLLRKSLLYSLVAILCVGAWGISVNVLDLTLGTHFTKDPEIGLPLGVLLTLFTIGAYFLAHCVGSRHDNGSVAYLERKLAAFVEHPLAHA